RPFRHRRWPDRADVVTVASHGGREACRPLIGPDDHGNDLGAAWLHAATRLDCLVGKLDQGCKLFAALRFLLAKAKGGAHRRGYDRRRRRRKNKWPGIVDHKVMQDFRRADQGARGAERLPASVKRNDIVSPLQPAAKALTIRPENAGGVGLVDDEDTVVAFGDGGEIFERGAVAIHTIKTLDGDPRPALMASGTPAADFLLHGVGVVVRGLDTFGSSSPHAVVGARMDERVVDDKIAALRQGCKKRVVR